jgi:hypothetical protein
MTPFWQGSRLSRRREIVTPAHARAYSLGMAPYLPVAGAILTRMIKSAVPWRLTVLKFTVFKSVFTSKKAFGLALLASVCLVLSGCDKVTPENYSKIKEGMTVSQVEDILGPGTENVGAAGAIGDLAGSVRVMTWGDDKKSITVTFVNDKVVAKVAQGAER